MSIFETHIHFATENFSSQLGRYLSSEPFFLYLNVATTPEDSLIVIEQSRKYSQLYCAIGVHPLYLPKGKEALGKTISLFEEKLLEDSGEKILAIGECGLDFYKAEKETSGESQLTWLRSQLDLSEKFRLPTVLHLRGAYREALELLQEYPRFRGIIHSFDGSKEELLAFLAHPGECFISFSPLIFRNISKFRELIPLVPTERILVESDSPFLATGPSICRSILRVISEFKGIPLHQLRKSVFENSLRLFNLSSSDCKYHG